MSFEDQLRPAFDTLTDRLREDIDRHVTAALEELSARAATLAESADAERAAAVADVARAAREEAAAAAEEEHRAALAALEMRLADEVSAVDDQKRAALADLETRLTEEATAAIERFQTSLTESEEKWRGIVTERDAAIERAVETHRDELERLAREHREQLERERDDARTQAVASLQAADVVSGQRLVRAFRAIDAAGSLSDILDALASAIASEAPRSAIFLTGNAQVKSWKAQGFGTLELPLADAGIVAAAIETRDVVHAGGDSAQWAPEFAALSDDRTAVAIPMSVNTEVVAVVYADEGAFGDPDRASWASAVELIARHASRSLEAITSHRLARTLGSGATRPRNVAKPADVVAPPVAVEAAPSAPVLEAIPQIQPVLTGIDAERAAAQHYAHSLILEIRRAHEVDVIDGLREGDLMTRLGGPISRAWAQYEAKVPETIRTATNYFHAEMVRTLADGDASLLSPRA